MNAAQINQNREPLKWFDSYSKDGGWKARAIIPRKNRAVYFKAVQIQGEDQVLVLMEDK